MKIGILKNKTEDKRIAAIPKTIQQFKNLNFDIEIEKNLATDIGVYDNEYEALGCIVKSRDDILKSADIILGVNPIPIGEIPKLKKGSIHISFLNPFDQKELIDTFLKNNITTISLDLVPRSTIAQKMDGLSSQANLAGYESVILAAHHLNRILPMMTTPAGTISPAKVFVIGAGVAGLQAIATAKRLGARVEAFDTRAVVEEQIKSLGAKFIKIDLGETKETKQGYAKALSKEQLDIQKNEMKKICSYSDIIITTAQIFGKKAPIIITEDMIQSMKPKSVIIDLSIQSGGNVEGSEIGKVIEKNQVKIIGPSNILNDVAFDASYMLSSNFLNLISHFYDKDNKNIRFNIDDDVFLSCVLTHMGKITSKFLTGE